MRNKIYILFFLVFISCESTNDNYSDSFNRYNRNANIASVRKTQIKSDRITYSKSNYKNYYKNPDSQYKRLKKSKKFDISSSYKKNKHGYQGYYKVGKPYSIKGRMYYPKEEPNYKEVGMASWYGEDFHDKKTANGEIYDMHDMTAAHRTLPLPSMVLVTNLENGMSAKVRINDRGPFAKERIIDLSKTVAKKLEFKNQGTTKVKVEFLKEDTERMLKYYGLR